MGTRYLAATVGGVLLLMGVLAGAQSPGPGEPCPAEGATVRDAGGRMMWCAPRTTSDHNLVWQYTSSNLPS
jgi:hypothetical protein